MEKTFRYRNNDLGVCVPTHQERMNSMLSAENAAQAQAFNYSTRPTTPHMPSPTEVEQTLTMVETEAQNQNEDLLQVHAGLDKERVSRLLALLR